jgi:hypothetical protein
MNKTHVLVDIEYLEDLRADAMFLDALAHCGVAKWSGYKEALEVFSEILKEGNE